MMVHTVESTDGQWVPRLVTYMLLILSLGGLSVSVRAAEGFENPPTVYLDRYYSFETGAGLTHAAVWGLGSLEDLAFEPLRDNKVGGPSARFLRTLVFDAPIAWWFGVLEHEAFGHGGRAREFGAETDVHMGSPWGGRDSYSAFDSEGFSTEKLLIVFTGGSESNRWTATLLERELVAGRRMRPLELLFLTSNRFVVSDYVLRTTPDPRDEPQKFYQEWAGGGDVANYLGYLNTLHNGAPEITPTGSSDRVVREYRRLKRQAYWNAFDPGAWLGLWGAARYVARGDTAEPVPLPRVAGRRFLPIFTSDWHPDGGLMSLELVFGPRSDSKDTIPLDAGSRWHSVTLRRGHGPSGHIAAVGAAADQVFRGEHIRLGGEAEIWHRPRHGLGGGFRARISPAEGWLKSLFLDVGVKSDGHWPGRPASTGPFLLIGVSSQP